MMKRLINKENIGITLIALVVAFIVGAVLASGIVYAAVSAHEVSYTRTGTSIKNVEEALNDLYSNTTHGKTLLWSNTSPNNDFAEQSITLNQSANNFTHIMIYWKDYPSSTETYEHIYRINPWHATYFGDTASGTYVYVRELQVNDTTAYVTTGRHVWGSGSNNGLIIPCEIYGLNL